MSRFSRIHHVRVAETVDQYSEVLTTKQIVNFWRSLEYEILGFACLMAYMLAMFIVVGFNLIPFKIVSVAWYVGSSLCVALIFVGLAYAQIFMRSVKKTLGVRGRPLYAALMRGDRARFYRVLSRMQTHGRFKRELKDARRRDAERVRRGRGGNQQW